MTLDEIPYLTCVPRDGRDLILQPWYDIDVQNWHLYAEVNPDNYIRMQMQDWSSGTYYARGPAHSADLYLPLGTLIAQHLSFPPVTTVFYSLIHDIELLSSSLEKLELIRLAVPDRTLSSFLVETELEYLFVLVRSMYDLLQKAAKRVGKLLCNADGTPAIAELPDSFASIVLDGDRPRTAAELAAKYRLPSLLAAFYAKQAPLFLSIRAIRVALEHHGKGLPTVFITEQGLGISTDGSPTWTSLDVWRRHELLPNGIGSVRALAAYLAHSFLETLATFEQALRSIISPVLLPKAVSEGNSIYLKNPSIHRLSGLEGIITSPWG